MTATTLPDDKIVLTDEQIDAYIAFNIARVEMLMTKRRRDRDFTQSYRQAPRLVPCA